MDGESESSRTGSIVSAVPSTWKDDVPQKLVDTFWKSFNSKYPGRVLKALPYRPGKTASQPISNIAHGEAALDSYDRAKRECEHAVDRIVKQCLRINQKYTDPHFDIERDLKSGQRNFLDGLQGVNSEMKPKGVKRVTVRIFFNFFFFPCPSSSLTSTKVYLPFIYFFYRTFSRNQSST